MQGQEMLHSTRVGAVSHVSGTSLAMLVWLHGASAISKPGIPLVHVGAS